MEPKEKILDVLQNNNGDMSIQEITDNTDFSRKTIEKYIEVLKAENKVECTRKIGRAKMYNIGGKADF